MAEEEAPQLLNYQPIFQKFVLANHALLDCMAAIPKDEAMNMSASQLDGNCQREKNNIKSILESNKMTMTQLVKDRVNVMNTIKQVGIKKEWIETE